MTLTDYFGSDPRGQHQDAVQSLAVVLSLMMVSSLCGSDRPGTWTGDYRPCNGHGELLKRGRKHVGVRFSSSNHELGRDVAQALDFWATVVDMEWHQDSSRNCAIQIVDGSAKLFDTGQIARAQFPDSASFQGGIAFNPRYSSRSTDLFSTAVHELGHLLGLPHSNSASSVMYPLTFDGRVFLDSNDLLRLAARHTLRDGLRLPMGLVPVLAVVPVMQRRAAWTRSGSELQ